MTFNGMRVIVHMEMGDFDLIKRPWRERLFTRPWRPFTTHNKIERDPRYFVDTKRGVIHTSPRGLDAIRNYKEDTL